MAGVAILDANVLYSAPLRDLLLQLAYDGSFQARWTAEIDAEWTRNLFADRPALTPHIPSTLAMLRDAFPDRHVVGFERLIPDLMLPDPGDRHVLAAAIAAEADTIVTFNLRDFPANVLAAFQIEARHPDAFVCDIADASPHAILASVRTCLGRLTNPPVTAAGYVRTMRRVGLVRAADFLLANGFGGDAVASG